jgi:hypothetical protein
MATRSRRSRSRRFSAAPMARRSGPRSWQPDTAFAGYYRRAIELPADAATGSWNLELRADPAAKLAGTSMPFAVEEFLPERMQLDLTTASERLSGEADPGRSTSAAVTSTVRRPPATAARRRDQRAQPQSAGAEAARLRLR